MHPPPPLPVVIAMTALVLVFTVYAAHRIRRYLRTGIVSSGRLRPIARADRPFAYWLWIVAGTTGALLILVVTLAWAAQSIASR